MWYTYAKKGGSQSWRDPIFSYAFGTIYQQEDAAR